MSLRHGDTPVVALAGLAAPDVMRWTCLRCGSTRDCSRPGYPAADHTDMNGAPCSGPLVAQNVEGALGLASLLDRAHLRPNR